MMAGREIETTGPSSASKEKTSRYGVAIQAEPEDSDFYKARRTMLIIAVSQALPIAIDIEWLVRHLPPGEGAAEQLQEAAVVMLTTPDARIAKILRNDAELGEDLDIHSAAMG